MDAFEAMRGRRSHPRVKPERPSREEIERILEAATWAPNHHNTEPWRFFVLTGKALDELGEVMAQALKARLEEQGQEVPDSWLETERAKPRRAPVVIAVAVDRPRDEKVLEIENIEAVAAAIQNMLIAAHASGLAAYWRTGDAAYDPRVKAHFGLSPDEFLAGFVYVGYPLIQLPPAERIPAAEKTEWRGWDR